MKAVLNVKGTKLSVLSIHYRVTGGIALIYAADENGRESRYIEKSHSQYETLPHVALDSLEDALEFPEHEVRIVEDRNKLIEHLEEMQIKEGEQLRDFAQDSMESSPKLPFDNHLSAKKEEYDLKKQRLLGVIDTIEEVKAYTEGFYANVDDPAVEA